MTSARRRQGRYYTPDWLVRELLAGCAFEECSGEAPPTILDPACGEGAFLLPFLEERIRCFPDENGRSHLDWVVRSLHGVDIDAEAVARLRHRIAERLASSTEADQIAEMLRHNFLHGDALTGPDFDACEPTPTIVEKEAHADAAAVRWAEAFPEVAARGGFDWVVGNPPYRRERYARELFEELGRSALGRKWRQPRMDLWHYFLHRSLDLLRPGGRLLFLVNGYWASARSANRLIARLRDEATFEEIRRIDGQHLFEGVTGRHMAFRIRKGRFETACVVRDADQCRTVPQPELFQGDRVVSTCVDSPLDAVPPARRLSDRFEVRQGIAENPPWIGSAHLRQWPGEFRLGEGVFVLTPEECAAIEWTDAERALLRPYFQARRIGRYSVSESAPRQLLYLTRGTAPNLNAFPNIARHLGRFRPILERRREVQRGVIDWWHLHWPREERLFVEPRILAVQMGYEPQFAMPAAPTFVGFSVNVIRPAPDEATEERFALAALLGVLNSALAATWFRRHAKHRGANLDISGTVLREFPLPPVNSALAERVACLAERRQALTAGDAATCDAVEGELDATVLRWYGL